MCGLRSDLLKEKGKNYKYFSDLNVLIDCSSDTDFEFLRFFVSFVGMHCTDLIHTGRDEKLIKMIKLCNT